MKSNDWRHKNVARYTPGNTKILYFFNCLLDGMHTIIIAEKQLYTISLTQLVIHGQTIQEPGHHHKTQVILWQILVQVVQPGRMVM